MNNEAIAVLRFGILTLTTIAVAEISYRAGKKDGKSEVSKLINAKMDGMIQQTKNDMELFEIMLKANIKEEEETKEES